MNGGVEVPLTVDTPQGSVDLVVDGSAPLFRLLPALAAAAGVDDPSGWRWWDGGRALDPASPACLDDLRVLPGSRLRLLPGPTGPTGPTGPPGRH